MRSITALLFKDLKVAWRAPLFASISILVPVAFTFLYAIVIHVSTTATIAVADEDDSFRSHQFVQVMEDMRNDDGQYYEILTTDPERAREMYSSGEVGAVLTIPDGFDDDLASGLAPQVELALFNINSDGTKNQHLRLEQALRTFNAEVVPASSPRLQIVETTAMEDDIPITIYLGSALILFAALYSGIVNAGVSLTREWEERTAKALILSPAGPGALVAGKWLASLVLSLVTIGCAAVGIGWVLGFPLGRLGPLALVSVIVIWAYGAALGTLLAVTLRRSLPLIPIAVILAVGHFLVSGYESYIRGFAHGGIAEVLWRSTEWIPLHHLFDAVRFEAAGLSQPPGLAWGLVSSMLIATALAAFAIVRLTRTATFTQGQ
ncbi:ABC transporter permease [Microbacterium esteraromaticum]|uniref:ABC transporter permease n=1 Tax=Microbacterium esteraromaticum TaxID=57043 RepID=UPI0015CEECC0